MYGPTKFQGLDVSNLFTFQKVEHILRLLKYCWAEEHLTGQLIHQSLEATKLEIGCEGPVLSKPFYDLGMLATPTWITHTWEYLSQNQMEIDGNVPDLSLVRDGDQFLIRVCQGAGYTGQQLRRLNICQHFLQAVSVSDITTGCGSSITQGAWNGKRDSTRASPFDWPAQGNPMDKDWVLWREVISKALCIQQRLLSKKRGWWLPDAPVLWYYDEWSEWLYDLADNKVLMYLMYHRVPGKASRAAD